MVGADPHKRLVHSAVRGRKKPRRTEPDSDGKEPHQIRATKNLNAAKTLLRKPIIGKPLSMGDYFRTPVSYHFLGLLGGCIWGIGMTFNLVAGAKVGVAISYAIGQASPMVACLWGVFVWKEFRGANSKAKGYLAAMFAAYILAIVLIASAH